MISRPAEVIRYLEQNLKKIVSELTGGDMDMKKGGIQDATRKEVIFH